MGQWLTLVYRVPREPTAARVYVWRKLKRLGAIALQDAVWVLPANPRTKELFQWLATEITELGGEATLWNSDLAYSTDEESLVRRFTEPVDAGYAELLRALKRKNADLETLSRRYQQLQKQDYFKSELGQKVRRSLISAHGGKRK